MYVHFPRSQNVKARVDCKRENYILAISLRNGNLSNGLSRIIMPSENLLVVIVFERVQVGFLSGGFYI